nr:reverse transcriptase [Tanacetum cinerariifolium]
MSTTYIEKTGKKLSEPKQEGGLGFRDFEAFNTALLAKQGWRLLINPHAFWGRILKGIYFPNSNFLVAKRGSHPSWLWSSLLHGRDLLLESVRWHVGNGQSISFWTQKWVPFNNDFYIRSSLGPFDNRSKDSSAAFGIVVRDSTGSLCYVLGNRCHAISLINAEIIAVHFACSLAYNRGWLNAIVESDSQMAISLYSSLESPLPWSLAALVDDIRFWAKSMQISFSWVNRERNQVADWVARYAFSNTLEFSWDVSLPDKLNSLSRSDMYGSHEYADSLVNELLIVVVDSCGDTVVVALLWLQLLPRQKVVAAVTALSPEALDVDVSPDKLLPLLQSRRKRCRRRR